MLYNALKAMKKDKEREELNSIIPDKELDDAFTNTNFGNITKRDVVRYALLKAACGYYSGHTAQRIINELGLCSKDLKLTKKGKKYLYASFRNGTNH